MSNTNFNVPTGEGIIIGSFNFCANGVDLGLTQGGVSIVQNNTYEEIRGDQSRSIIAKPRTAADYMVSATFLEPTLDKLRLFYGQTNNVIGSSLCLRDSGDCAFPEVIPIAIFGPGIGCGYRNYYFPRAIVTPGTIEQNIGINAPVAIQVEFTILPDADGFFGCMTDTTDMIFDPASQSLQTSDCVANAPVPDFVP